MKWGSFNDRISVSALHARPSSSMAFFCACFEAKSSTFYWRFKSSFDCSENTVFSSEITCKGVNWSNLRTHGRQLAPFWENLSLSLRKCLSRVNALLFLTVGTCIFVSIPNLDWPKLSKDQIAPENWPWKALLSIDECLGSLKWFHVDGYLWWARPWSSMFIEESFSTDRNIFKVNSSIATINPRIKNLRQLLGLVLANPSQHDMRSNPNTKDRKYGGEFQGSS